MSTTTLRSTDRTKPKSETTSVRPSFSLADTEHLGLQLQLAACTLLVGLGSTGTRIVDQLIRSVAASLGYVPPSLNYLMIDGEATNDLYGLDHFTCVGIDGCGTDPNEGRDAFLEIYPELFKTVEGLLLKLNPESDVMPAAVSPQTCVEVYVFAGNGGTSGGMQQPCITLLNEVMQKRRIRTPRIHNVFLGVDMPMNDASRTTTDNQIEITAATAWANIRRMVFEHWNPEPIREESPTGGTVIPAGGRVESVGFMDQSNGRHQLGTTDELMEMVAAAYFAAICTHASLSVSARMKDLEKTGETVRAFCSAHGISL